MGFFNTVVEMMTAFFSDIRLNYIVDIGIIAYVFYKLLTLIKETRAEQLVKGFVVILIVSRLSEWLKLYSVNYILNGAFTIGLIALVILFQPELRKALEHVGRTKWILLNNKRQATTEIEEMIDEVVEASTTMSRKKIGALMVFERSMGIKDIIETGTVLDARTDSELIQNIFFPKSPLHDGAMVIRGTRIMAAGCLLPLTTNKFVSKELGTRHRAALGMNESSDAVVVVVSEETGAISVVLDGKLNRFLDATTLKEMLIKSLVETNTESNGGKRDFKWFRWGGHK
ncbi:MAG: diadenylate cyclase CdaA [Bacillota bacterium]|nr:diadenylate cyclase CdaA [Bacillota bacterium]